MRVKVGQIWKNKSGQDFKVYSKSDIHMTTMYYCEYLDGSGRWGMGIGWFDGVNYSFVK